MRATGSRILVKVDVPGETRLESGLYTPAPNTNFGGKLYVSERREDEWWPRTAKVVCSNPSGFVSGLKEGHEEVWDRHTKTHVRMMVHDRKPHWRMPAPGDTVWFSSKGLNPDEMDGNGEAWVDPNRITCVESPDGSIWAVGRMCLVEQLPVEAGRSAIIADINPRNRTGVGIVRLAGDGFMEMVPGLGHGMVVRFKVVSGDSNPVVDTPLGEMCPLLPDWIIGIDPRPVPEEEIAELKAEAARVKAEVANALAHVHSVRQEDEEERRDRVIKENEEANWRHSAKMRDKHHERRLF